MATAFSIGCIRCPKSAWQLALNLYQAMTLIQNHFVSKYHILYYMLSICIKYPVKILYTQRWKLGITSVKPVDVDYISLQRVKQALIP